MSAPQTSKPWLPLALLLAAGIATLWTVLGRHAVPHGPGILVSDVPLQRAIRDNHPLADRAGAKLRALNTFELHARVLSRADYRFDRGAALAPIDLALGWQRMSDSSVLEKIEISQSNRFFHWRVKEFPIPESEIIASAANMHMIPADASVEHELRRTRVGDIVHLRGFLVEAQMPDGGTWRSSTTRTDSGDGACELILVELAEITEH